MIELVFFLEEVSAKYMLQGFLHKILPEYVCPRFVVFEGKTDLERSLPLKLRAWNKPNCIFIVLRDQDSGNCLKIKQNLLRICRESNKPDTLIRIACRELESWYIGDLKAVEAGLDIPGISQHQNKSKFRTPDSLTNASEELLKLTNGKYQKVSGSRAIGPHLEEDRNLSNSFSVFVKGIRAVCLDSGKFSVR